MSLPQKLLRRAVVLQLLLISYNGMCESAEDLCLNQIQVLATHNSYHLPPDDAILDLLSNGLIALALGPTAELLPEAWQYEMRPLAQQLDAGVRGLELDVYYDPDGGAYRYSAVLKLLGKEGKLEDERWAQPGFKVFHLPDADFNTNCVLLRDCLDELRDWSDANPGHLPITVYLEPKTGSLLDAFASADGSGGGTPNVLINGLLTQLAEGEGEPKSLTSGLAWPEEEGLAELAAEVEEAMGGRAALLTPDDVIEHAGSLQQAVQRGAEGGDGCTGWPPLNSTLGKFLFVVISTPASEAMHRSYSAAHPGLRGAVLWLEGRPGSETNETAFLAVGDLSLKGGSVGLPEEEEADMLSKALQEDVEEWVKAGYIVRSHADSDLEEIVAGYTGRRDAVLAGGAHVVASDAAGGSTLPEEGQAGEYEIYLPLPGSTQEEGGEEGQGEEEGLHARCNPVTAPKGASTPVPGVACGETPGS